MSKSNKSPRERAQQIIKQYQPGTGRFKQTEPPAHKGGADAGGADAARERMLAKQRDPDRVYKGLNPRTEEIASARKRGELWPD